MDDCVMGGFSDIAAGLRPYPDGPGYKTDGTSKDAAEAVSSTAGFLRERVFNVIIGAGDLGKTPDEIAAILGKTVLAVRPRVSELKKAGRIRPNGLRRANESGLKADALVVA
jgi:hypothetical protein